MGRADEGRRRDRAVLQHGQRRSVPRKRHHRHRAGFQEAFHDDPQHHRAAPPCRPHGRGVFPEKGVPQLRLLRDAGHRLLGRTLPGFPRDHRAGEPDFTFSSLRSGAQNDLWYYDTAQLITWLQSLPKPVAIMACDDNQAYHITEACLQIEGGGKFAHPQRHSHPGGRQRRDDLQALRPEPFGRSARASSRAATTWHG